MTAHLHRPGRSDPGPDDQIPRIDGQIRPGLRKAFPLPDSDDRFHRLLEALAAKSRFVAESDRPRGH